MIEGLDMPLIGQRDLIRDLRRFKEAVAIRAAKSAAKKVAEFVERRLRAEAPVFTGKLRFNLFVRAQYVKRRGVVRSTVAVRTVGKADNPRNAFYWRFIEWGHKTRPKNKDVKAFRNRRRNKGGDPLALAPGQKFVKGDHFILRTYSAIQTQAQAIFFRELDATVARFGRKSKNLR